MVLGRRLAPVWGELRAAPRRAYHEGQKNLYGYRQPRKYQMQPCTCVCVRPGAC
jgi:hypothetical protein